MPALKPSRSLFSTNPTLPFSSFLPPLYPGNHHLDLLLGRQRRRVSMDNADNTNISSTSTNNNDNNKKELGSRVDKLQQVIHSHHSSDGKNWEMSWEQGLTPWDLGQPTPVLLHLLQTGQLPKGRALVPGCGTGYDVVAIACPERYVVGLDISEVAVKKAKQLSSTSPNVDYLTFLKEDFFNWHPPELFDLIFDYTFFCAIEPDMRPAWARQTCNLLKPDGELITLMFPVSDHIGGPPYKVSIADYEEVLRPVGFKAMSVVENDLAVGPRKGREILGRWKRLSGNSSL